MARQTLVNSFNAAIEGFVYVIKSQRNMKFHFIIAAVALFVGFYFNFSKIEMLILGLTITFVLVAEMINTAVELTADIITDSFHPVIRIIKDVTAGAVLIACINAVIIGYIIFSKYLRSDIEFSLTKIRHSPWHITFIALIVVIVLVVLGKLLLRRGTPMQGGMPSGHAAVAFSIWTLVTFISKNWLMIVLVFLMAFLIAQARVKEGIHNIWEVLAGSILGILVTTLIFQFLK